jgi:hypothetical protein
MHAKKSASNRAPQNRGVRRVAEPDDEIPKINPSDVETLIKKIEQTTLSEQDKRREYREHARQSRAIAETGWSDNGL